MQDLTCLTSEHWDVVAAELRRGGTRVGRAEASKMDLDDDIFDSFFACIGSVKEAKVYQDGKTFKLMAGYTTHSQPSSTTVKSKTLVII